MNKLKLFFKKNWYWVVIIVILIGASVTSGYEWCNAHKNLQTEISKFSADEAQITSLTTSLATTNKQLSKTKTDLTTANSSISSLNSQLQAAENKPAQTVTKYVQAPSTGTYCSYGASYTYCYPYTVPN